ncbi:MAG: hypothetical protein COV44_10735 [Deltaproteobacteria bacterium CG11_big_fil_rev_8_21_14_0_20_45_16]|nr:MAG: hypothetical protein COV44_10735 [Deltaproteobacteria bacterium CG11_big_fil_rev_8_21_14_0_20_45_16]
MSKWAFILIASSSCLLASCGNSAYTGTSIQANSDGKDAKKPPPPTNLTASELAYQLTLFPIVSEHCQSCHSTVQAPFFAKDDLVAAHSISLSNELVTLDKPSTSRLYLKVLNFHNCWSGNCSDDAEDILTAIQSWAEALSVELVENDKYVTGNLVVPASLVNMGASEMLEFSLSGIDDSVPSDAILQLKIERFSLDSYRIKDLKMHSSQALAVNSVSILINAADSQVGGVFKQVDTIVPANVLSSLSDGSQFASVGFNLPQGTGGPSVDEISVQFESIATPDSL